MHPPAISCILPIYNEERCLPPLLEELDTALRDLKQPFEIICVDDASTDNGPRLLQALCRTHAHLRVLRHFRNLGQSAAFASGFQAARAPILCTMDADMQHDPADIPMLLEALQPDTAMVCGIRAKRQDSWVKRFASHAANTFRNRVVGDHIADAGCTFRVVRGEALRDLFVFNGMHRFLPNILRIQGFKVVERPIRHRPRISGASKYGINNRLWRGLADCFAMRWYARRALPAQRWTEVSSQQIPPHD